MDKKSAIFFIVILIIFSGCKSIEYDESARRTTTVRLSDIESWLYESPLNAINLINIYKEIYSTADDHQSEDWFTLVEFEKEAVENLLAKQESAVNEQRWEEAVFLGRSIANMGLVTEYSGMEAVFILNDAKQKLQEGNNLSAFLSAVKSHEINPLDFDSALLFLEKAVEARQRRTSAYFLAAARRASPGAIPSSLLDYAQGSDTVSDMVKGVATVIVDKGMRIERGMGIPDRVLGTAFFIDSSGLLITNYHVIESEVDPKYNGYSRMYIRMGDSTSPRVPARVVGWDKALDLALIKTEIQTEYVFSIIDRVIPQAGDMVLAIGSPLGLEKTVTSGIVSAIGRRFLQVGDVIQIDAAINSGNSGGPVIDSQGRLVGVAFAGIAQHQGLNFAVPAAMLAAALPEMIKGGKARRSWLGLTLSETVYGAEIIYAAPNTPAADFRISEGSYIKSVNGKNITANQGALIPALQDEIFGYSPGELVSLEVAESGGAVKKYVIMTALRPDIPLLEAAKIDSRERIAAPLFGMILTPLQSTFFSSNYSVDKVILGSIADSAGISENDPLSINRFRILEEEGYALLEITIKKRRLGFLETSMQIAGYLDLPDTL